MDKEQEQPKSTGDQADCHTVTEAEIDAAIEGSFPASDPLPWTLGKVSCPDPDDELESSPESEEK
jgi:hypothetical protein